MTRPLKIGVNPRFLNTDGDISVESITVDRSAPTRQVARYNKRRAAKVFLSQVKAEARRLKAAGMGSIKNLEDARRVLRPHLGGRSA